MPRRGERSSEHRSSVATWRPDRGIGGRMAKCDRRSQVQDEPACRTPCKKTHRKRGELPGSASRENPGRSSQTITPSPGKTMQCASCAVPPPSFPGPSPPGGRSLPGPYPGPSCPNRRRARGLHGRGHRRKERARGPAGVSRMGRIAPRPAARSCKMQCQQLIRRGVSAFAVERDLTLHVSAATPSTAGCPGLSLHPCWCFRGAPRNVGGSVDDSEIEGLPGNTRLLPPRAKLERRGFPEHSEQPPDFGVLALLSPFVSTSGLKHRFSYQPRKTGRFVFFLREAGRNGRN